MIEPADPRRTLTIDTPGVRAYCTGGADGRLVFYSPTGNGNWLSAREPLDLHKWR